MVFHKDYNQWAVWFVEKTILFMFFTILTLLYICAACGAWCSCTRTTSPFIACGARTGISQLIISAWSGWSQAARHQTRLHQRACYTPDLLHCNVKNKHGQVKAIFLQTGYHFNILPGLAESLLEHGTWNKNNL